MLVLSRKEGESIAVGDNVVLTVVRINGDKVRIGVDAPAKVKVLRTELEAHPDDRRGPNDRPPLRAA